METVVNLEEYKVMFEFDISFFLNPKTWKLSIDFDYYIIMRNCLKGNWLRHIVPVKLYQTHPRWPKLNYHHYKLSILTKNKQTNFRYETTKTLLTFPNLAKEPVKLS